MNWQEEWSAVENDASLRKNQEEKGLLKAGYRYDYILRLWFEDELDVSIYELDFRPLIVDGDPDGLFAPLKDQERFKQARGEHALIWPDPETGAHDKQAIKMEPERVRFFAEKHGRPLKVTARRWLEEPYEPYWIAYFDQLGFKNRVRQSWVREVLDGYEAAIDEVESKGKTRGLKYKWFSDTFLLYVKDESRDSCNITGAASHFFLAMLGKSIAMRGALAYGGLYVGERGELFGPALIDAYEEAEAQDWLGFVIHKTAKERLKQYSVNGRSVADILREYDYREYNVPFTGRRPHGTQESQPGERDLPLAYTIISLPDVGKPSDVYSKVDDMQANADYMMLKGHSAAACAACEDERRRVRRKYENTKDFIRDTVSKYSKGGGIQGQTPK